MPTYTLTRRQLIGSLSVSLASTVWPDSSALGTPVAGAQTSDSSPLPAEVLPKTVRSRFLNDINGLRMHVLEAGFETPDRPGVLLVHGFPELAFSWRRIMPGLAAAGYHVIAPDLRGYGRTDGSDITYDSDLRPYRMMNEIRDMLGLVSAFGYRRINLVGHDFGALVASWCAVARPDIFRSVVLMSAPFGGTATLPFDTANETAVAPESSSEPDIYEELAQLSPPRKHYRSFYATRDANENMWNAPQGVHAFLRAYYHMKSADWPGNQPRPLQEWSATELSKLPHYYVMELEKGMAETVAAHMPSAAQIANCEWLPDSELAIYSTEYKRTGFQGGLQWYRSNTSASSLFGRDGINGDLQVYAGRTIDQPSLFISGSSDWGVYQRPGAIEQMESSACTDLRGIHLLEGAGHWVQQEQPEMVSRLLLEFLGRVSGPTQRAAPL